MLSNRRNLIFRVSIVINVAVLLYAALHWSGNVTPEMVWVPMPVDPTALRYETRNDTEIRTFDSRAYDDSTALNKTPFSTTTRKTTISTTSTLDLDKKNSLSSLEPTTTNETSLEIVDENALSEATWTRLQTLLACNEKEYVYQVIQRGEYWVLKNYVQAEHGVIRCHETITYTTHAGFEYLDNVLPLAQRWMGPVSLAIHAPALDFDPTVESIRYLRDCLGTDLIRQFVTFHIFFSFKHIPNKIPDPDSFLQKPFNCSNPPPYNVNSSSTYMKTTNLLYPVNVARNIAREAALTHFVLPSDIELYPSPNLIPRFLNMIARNNKPLNDDKPHIFPISLFEVSANVQVPLSKTELQAMLKNKTAIPFHKYVCPHCHNIPQSKQWISAKETNQMDVFHVGKRKGKFGHWEPIFIGTHFDPYYDERLSWDGKMDKMPHSYILCILDYDFMILNNAFLIHKPGIKHFVKNKKRDSIVSKQGAFVKNRVLPELNKIFGTKPGCVL